MRTMLALGLLGLVAGCLSSTTDAATPAEAKREDVARLAQEAEQAALACDVRAPVRRRATRCPDKGWTAWPS